MKTLILLLFSFNLYAQVSMEDCVEAGKLFGSQRDVPVIIPSECKKLIIKAENNQVSKLSSNRKIKIFGFKNLLFIKLYEYNQMKELVFKTEHFISGENAMLTDIVDILIDEIEQKVYVLNKKNDEYGVFTYFYSAGGNIVPARKLLTSELTGASKILLDNTLGEIIVLSRENGWIKFFNKEADPDGRRVENSVELKRKLSGPDSKLLYPQDMVTVDGTIYIVDSNRLLAFDKTLKTKKANLIYSVSHKEKNYLEKIKYDLDQQTFIITCSDSSQIELKLKK